ncbi:peptidase associated/transthyretin-like domain-containing protein [Mucilaginibacter myungsuensis]|uniref:Rhamnogalacturonan lyase domain-containing protein n=1 Tax=Mucilaginibacter myungsuensis TaxID=649104 RepID=A0A929PW58_9SPHI|nr:hypothetical protein [Mucilaginibacter myungsuensis]MBE9662478.1 hypothetical protein [Mucilaginibacter myungsuensis]MDN3597898.1 hypothetical protein [Mucilaginibacter myungsuensis]
MKKQLLGLVFLSSAIVGCKKDSGPTPSPTPIVTTPNTPVVVVTAKGSLSGTVSPAGSVKAVSVKAKQSGAFYYGSIDPVTGVFSIPDVPEGDHELNFTVNEFHQSLASKDVTVAGGKNTAAGTFSPIERSFMMSCYVNGQYQGWVFKGYYTSALMQLVSMSGGGTVNQSEERYNLGISLGNVAGPGTYVCNSTTGNTLRYTISRSLPTSIQSTETEGSSAIVEITAIDPVARTIKGTFSGTLVARNPTSNDAKVITKGIINATY